MRLSIYIAVAAACVLGCWPGAACAQTFSVLRPSRTIEVEAEQKSGKPPVITAVAVRAGGGIVATAGDDHVVRLWSTENGQLLHLLKGHDDWVRTLAFSPDGKLLVSAGDDRRIIQWQVDDAKRGHDFPPHPYAIYAVAFSPDGEQLAAAGFEHKVRLYDLASGALVKELDGPGQDLRSVAFSPDGKQLAAGGRNGQIRVWTMPEATVRLEIAAGMGRIRTLGYLPGSERLVSAGEGRRVLVWDAGSGDQLQELDCRTGKVMSMAVCGESLIATGGSDNVVRIWNWQTEAEAAKLLGHAGSVASLAFDPASGTIISGSFDTTVRVWKLEATDATSTDTAADPHKELRAR